MTNLYTYNTYLKAKTKPIITIEECEEIYQALLENIDKYDEVIMELWEELLEKCIRYQELRARWSLYSRKEKMDKDSLRTSVHDTVIISFNMLSRYMEQQGKTNKWREKLGDSRKRIGDFACYITFIYAINNR